MNTKPKVLIVDDEERFRSTMRKLLLAEGLKLLPVETQSMHWKNCARIIMTLSSWMFKCLI